MKCCFLPCFRASKRTQGGKANVAATAAGAGAEGAVEPASQLTQQQKIVVEPIDCIAAESKIRFEEQLNEIDEVKSTKELRTESFKEEETIPQKKKKNGANETLLQEEEQECSESLFSLSIGSKKQVSSAAEKAETEVNSPMLRLHGEKQESQVADKEAKEEEEEGKARPYRYQDFSDEGYEDMNLNGSDFQEEQESSESFFSLPVDSRKPISSPAAEREEDNEVNSLMLPPPTDAAAVEEEETQGRIKADRAVKSPKKDDKENINNVNIPLSPTEHSLKLSKRKAAAARNKLSDTSLSSWLVVEPEESGAAATPVSKDSNGSVGEQTPRGSSPWSNEDRPILGALTVEEIRMFSLSASSIRTRSRSPDETPIIGTVGSYWTHTGQHMDSNSTRSEKDAKRKSSSSTVKTRLERAFE